MSAGRRPTDRCMESWLSGLRRTTGNRVTANTRSGVRIPLSPPEKKQPLSTKTKVVSFQLNPPCWVGEIIFDDEIPFGDEIRLGGGGVDLISSA